jgi:hypothetical protein
MPIAACAISPPQPTAIVFEGPLPDDPGPDVGGKALQAEIFADGVVTADEYERAMVAAVQCMRAEGFEVEGPLHYPEGGISVEPGYDPTHELSIRARVANDPQDRYGDINARCQAQWSYAVERVYLSQFEPTEAEIRAWLERAWRCLEENRQPLSSPPAIEEALSSVAFGCRPWEADR